MKRLNPLVFVFALVVVMLLGPLATAGCRAGRHPVFPRLHALFGRGHQAATAGCPCATSQPATSGFAPTWSVAPQPMPTPMPGVAPANYFFPTGGGSCPGGVCPANTQPAARFGF